MHQAGDGTELASHAVQQRTQLRGVPDIGGGVADPGTGRRQRGQGGPHLAVGQDALRLLLQLLRGDLEPLSRSAGEQRPLELRICGQPLRLRRLVGEFGAPDQHESGLGLLRQGDHRTGGHPAGATRDDDHVLRTDAVRAGGHLLRVRDDRGPSV